MKYLLGIDAGTSGIKAVVINTSGEICGSGYCECNITTPKPGWVEQNPAEWWDACDQAVQQAVTVSGKGKDIGAIGFSGQMQGSVLLDKDGNAMDRCMIWMDQRAHAEADELNQRLTRDEIMSTTASFCLPSYWAAKLLWLRKHRADVFDRVAKVIFPKDYLRYRMTGEIATEVSDASCSWFLDLKQRAWSDKMFEVAGLPKFLVPERLLESQDVAGYLRKSVADRWGMQEGIPVVAGAGDQSAGGVGMGAVKPGNICCTIGTSGVVYGCSDAPFVDPEPHGMYSQCHAVPEQYCFLGCTLGAGGSFKWMRDSFFADKKLQLAEEGNDVYNYMTELASKVQPGCEGLVFLPYLAGEGTPHVDANARGVFFGLSYRSDLGAMCRAVMEGVTFSLRDTIEICRSTGIVIQDVRASGGGAKSALWRQIQADVYNADVYTMNVDEAPAAGAAILAGVGAGYFKNVEEGCAAIAKVSSVTHPIAKNVAMYEDYYQIYRHLYRSLRSDFQEQAKIVEKYICNV